MLMSTVLGYGEGVYLRDDGGLMVYGLSMVGLEMGD